MTISDSEGETAGRVVTAFEKGDPTKLKRAGVDRLGITDDLILDGTGQGSREVLCTKALGEHIRIVSLHDDIHAVDIFLAVLTQETCLLSCNFMDDLFKPRSHRTSEDLPPSPWAPDNMVYNQMDSMIIMNVVHVYGLACIDTSVKRRTRKSPCAPAPNKVGQFIPRINDGGFPGRGSVMESEQAYYDCTTCYRRNQASEPMMNGEGRAISTCSI